MQKQSFLKSSSPYSTLFNELWHNNIIIHPKWGNNIFSSYSIGSKTTTKITLQRILKIILKVNSKVGQNRENCVKSTLVGSSSPRSLRFFLCTKNIALLIRGFNGYFEYIFLVHTVTHFSLLLCRSTNGD